MQEIIKQRFDVKDKRALFFAQRLQDGKVFRNDSSHWKVTSGRVIDRTVEFNLTLIYSNNNGLHSY